MLARAVASLEDDLLGFRTFFFPSERDGENWNFYSGEALLFWSEAARRGVSVAPSLERCPRVFEICRARHRHSRNPAFVPWHTQACASLSAQTARWERCRHQGPSTRPISGRIAAPWSVAFTAGIPSFSSPIGVVRHGRPSSVCLFDVVVSCAQVSFRYQPCFVYVLSLPRFA